MSLSLSLETLLLEGGGSLLLQTLLLGLLVGLLLLLLLVDLLLCERLRRLEVDAVARRVERRSAGASEGVGVAVT